MTTYAATLAALTTWSALRLVLGAVVRVWAETSGSRFARDVRRKAATR